MAYAAANPAALLPPLLACLQTARVSRRPPPDLLPLLTPILRQRINIWAGGPQIKNWASLLTWTAPRADSLASQIESLELEPHPVSGEIEVPEDVCITYRRVDAETLQARLETKDLGLAGIYVWCQHDEPGGGAGWRLGELMTIEHDTEISTPWVADLPTETHSQQADTLKVTQTEDDEDDYWALYDQQPASGGKQTPARPDPRAATSATAEQDYYDRYADEVETAISDPALAPDSEPAPVPAPAPRSEVKEESAAHHAAPQGLDTAQVGVRLHITSQISSLAQLAQTVGISNNDFLRIARAELDQLASDAE